ncbi:MAG: Hsp20/alpha crystallin family protein [candidate division NC10 bacterium]
MRIDDIFREMEELQKRMTEDLFKGFGSFENRIPDFDSLKEKAKSGELEGNWSFEPIERPGMKGFIARGFFSTPGLRERPPLARPPLDRPTDILPPLRPNPEQPREPLYDISVGKEQLTLYIELPGVDEKDIQLETEDGKLKLKAGSFETEVDLSAWVADPEKRTTEYKNGVLTVLIPKTGLDEQLI